MAITVTDFKCKLFEFISDDVDLQPALNYSASVLGVPVHITDAAYKLIAASDNLANPDPLWEELQTKGFFSEDTIKKFYSTQLTSNIASQSGPIFFETLGFPYIITPIFMSGNKVASLTALVSDKTDSRELYEYMSALADFIKNKFYIDNFQITYQSSRVELFLKDLLSGQACSQFIINERSHYFGFTENERYALLNISTAAGGPIFPVLYFKNIVKSNFPDALSVIYNNSIVLLFKFTDFRDYKTLNLSSINEYLISYNMHGCLSSPFNNLALIPKIYNQTGRAIAIGCHLQPDAAIYHYSKLSLYHLLESASSSLDLLSLCHPAVVFLKEYDTEHGSDYVETLCRFLMHRKKQDVQKELFIHRNTLNYRLEKIEALININWNDSDELFSMLLSCRIIRYINS